MNYIIRELNLSEYSLLGYFLYEAIFQRDDNNLLPRNIIERPEVKVFIADFGKVDDHCLVAEIADTLLLSGKTDDEKVTKLIEFIQKLKADIEIPLSIKDCGVTEAEFNAKLDELVELAFDDQCTGANPAYPLMKEIKQMYLDAYNGVC